MKSRDLGPAKRKKGATAGNTTDFTEKSVEIGYALIRECGILYNR